MPFCAGSEAPQQRPARVKIPVAQQSRYRVNVISLHHLPSAPFELAGTYPGWRCPVHHGRCGTFVGIGRSSVAAVVTPVLLLDLWRTRRGLPKNMTGWFGLGAWQVGSRAGVAQLVEHLICNQRVGGSNPFVSSNSAPFCCSKSSIADAEHTPQPRSRRFVRERRGLMELKRRSEQASGTGGRAVNGSRL